MFNIFSIISSQPENARGTLDSSGQFLGILPAELLEGEGCPLYAPVVGTMSRTIRESLRSTVRYRFWEGKALLFEHVDRCAGFEYAETDCRGECAGRHGI